MGTVVIDGRGSSQGTHYTIEATGDISVATDDTVMGIPVTQAATSASGTTANGHVGRGADAYHYEGELVNVELNNPSAAEVRRSGMGLGGMLTGDGAQGTDGGHGGIMGVIALVAAGIALVLLS